MILIFGFQKTDGGYKTSSYTMNRYCVMPYQPESEKTEDYKCKAIKLSDMYN